VAGIGRIHRSRRERERTRERGKNRGGQEGRRDKIWSAQSNGAGLGHSSCGPNWSSAKKQRKEGRSKKGRVDARDRRSLYHCREWPSGVCGGEGGKSPCGWRTDFASDLRSQGPRTLALSFFSPVPVPRGTIFCEGARNKQPRLFFQARHNECASPTIKLRRKSLKPICAANFAELYIQAPMDGNHCNDEITPVSALAFVGGS
jgi:hypothetical protein